MGCQPISRLQYFPSNHIRRAEWLQILKKESSVKNIYLCSRHFSPCNFFGEKLSNYAVPSPPLNTNTNYNPNLHTNTNVRNPTESNNYNVSKTKISSLHSHVADPGLNSDSGFLSDRKLIAYHHDVIAADSFADYGADFNKFNKYSAGTVVNDSIVFIDSGSIADNAVSVDNNVFPCLEDSDKSFTFFADDSNVNEFNISNLIQESPDCSMIEEYLDETPDQETADFDIPPNNNTFLTGRYVQTDNYISLNTPRKRSLKRARDLYRNKYRSVKRENEKIKAVNKKISKELDRYKEQNNNLKEDLMKIRKGSGNAKSITSRMFCSSFQRRWGLHYINVVVNGNCEEISPDDLMPDYSVILEDSVSAACCNDEFYSLPNPVLETSDNSEDVDMHYHEKEFLRVNAFNYGPPPLPFGTEGLHVVLVA
ncbi:hypothetical protein FF38_10477 [Lucilia cuprina]|uniref:THAP-type domain-containing protein n=1 Tax=Lucilia cuprina TaxID=7375 RepID=A0A0L0CK48_LUCCU|nr:hypothetical protein FF38_10477 [Lucilia cuprina]